MKPKQAKEILNCSYTTLHNYVKTGKIKLSSSTGKQQNYDEESVMALYNTQCKSTAQNCVHLFVNGEKFVFQLNSQVVSKIFDSLKDEIAKEIK